MNFRGFHLRALFLWAVLTCVSAPILAAEVTVFAAASLTDVLKEIADDYQKHTGVKVRFNFGASSILARQIEEGAPADIFFSADEAKMDQLQRKGLIAEGTRVSRLSNLLVIVVAAEKGANIENPAGLAAKQIRRVALAQPRTVPAGIYAKEYLENRGLWEAVQPKVIPTENVRGALAAVESGNVDAAIVYESDAAISSKVKIAYTVPSAEGPKISYPMGRVNGSKQAQAAERFLRHLSSAEAGLVFERFGFVVLKTG